MSTPTTAPENHDDDIAILCRNTARGVAADLAGQFRYDIAEELGYIQDAETDEWNHTDYPDERYETQDLFKKIADDEPFSSRYITRNQLDLMQIIDENNQYRGSILVVSINGPHVEINTRDMYVLVDYGSNHVAWNYHDGIGVNDALENLFISSYERS